MKWGLIKARVWIVASIFGVFRPLGVNSFYIQNIL